MNVHACINMCVCVCMCGGIASRGGSFLEGLEWAVGLGKGPGGFKGLKEVCAAAEVRPGRE